MSASATKPLERQRTYLFTPEEIHTLISCLEGMRGLVSGTKEYKTQAEQKEAWEYISFVVNSGDSGYKRDWRQLKHKWIDLKYRTRKKVALLKELYQSGSFVSSKHKLNDIDNRILELISNKSADEILSNLSEEHKQLSELRAVTSDDREESLPCNEYQSATPTKILIESPSSRKRPMKRFNENGDRIYCSSFDRVRKHRLKIRKQNEDNIDDFIKTQKQTYESLKSIEQSSKVGVGKEETIIQNQEKIISRLDSVVSLMSDFNGLMENLNDGINVLTQVIAAKNGIEIAEAE